MNPFRALLAAAALTSSAIGQPGDSTRRPSGTTVTGIVTDSISQAPLAGAVVQLVSSDGSARSGRTNVSDWLGRFSFTGVPNGRYTIGFFHPMLDSLGVDAPVREVIVAGEPQVNANIATPSPAQLRVAVCGAPDPGAIVVGVVRSAADGAPLAEASVTGKWLELSFNGKGIVNRSARLVARTGQNGWFALCGVPTAGSLSLIAAHSADSTDVIELEIPENGVVRRELFIGRATPEVATVGAIRADTLATAQARSGNATLSGIVVTADDGKAIAGAEVRISPRFRTRTNDRGEWTFPELPLGTRMLDVRAIGYSPDRRPVDVAAGALPVRVTLLTLSATLEAVRVSATARLHIADIAAFHARRRTGAGHYLTAADIERRGDLFTAEIFHSMPGLQIGYPYDTLPAGTLTAEDVQPVNRFILMRNISGEWCAPSIYVNGLLFPGLSADDLNTLVTTKEVAGIEIYTAASVPAQFKQTMTGCGAIAIWKK